MYDVPNAKRALIEKELRSEEVLRWIGQPKPISCAAQGATKGLFGLVWTMLMVLAFCVLVARNETMWGPLVALLFLIPGVVIMLLPHWLFLKGRKAVYAVTSKRAIIIEGVFNLSVRSLNGNSLTDIERLQRRDGSGDLVFKIDYSDFTIDEERVQTRVGFFGIPEVEKVEDLLDRISND